MTSIKRKKKTESVSQDVGDDPCPDIQLRLHGDMDKSHSFRRAASSRSQWSEQRQQKSDSRETVGRNSLSSRHPVSAMSSSFLSPFSCSCCSPFAMHHTPSSPSPSSSPSSAAVSSSSSQSPPLLPQQCRRRPATDRRSRRNSSIHQMLLLMASIVLVFQGFLVNGESINDCSQSEESDRSIVTCKVRSLHSLSALNILPKEGNNNAPVSLSLICHDILLHPSSLSLRNLNTSSSSSSSSSVNRESRVRELNVEKCKITEIPANAFHPLPSLVNLTIRTQMNEWSEETTRIHVNAFQSLHRLERLDMSQNNLNFMPQNLLCDFSSKLTFLNLTSNQFTEVTSIGLHGKSTTPSSSAACRFDALTRLELGHNKIKVLTDRGFALLPALQFLSLGHNLITRAEDTSLQGLGSLKRLDLSNNELVALPPRFLQPVVGSLEDLSLHNNSLSVLPPGLFVGMKKLIELDLSHNEITSHWVGPDTFSDLLNLQLLDLSFNRMSRVDAGTFKPLRSLTVLQLHHNEIESLAEDAFSNLQSLQTLVLNNNRITKLDSLPFSGLHGLVSLSLDANRLEAMNDELFKNVSNLAELTLSGNKLRAVPLAIERLSNLRSLDLSFNLISNISNTSYQGIEQLYGLNLEANRIGNLSKGVFSDLPSLRILNLAKNNIASIAQGTFDDVPDLHALRLDSNKIADINGLFVNLRDLLMLNISANRISWFDYALIPIGLHWLDIHSNQIESLGNYFEMESVLKLKSLDCSGNKIQEIDSASFPDGIEIIYIYNNSLKKVAPFTFMGKANLTRVDLTGNRLQNVDQNSFRLAKARLHRQPPEFSISNNPYTCDCNMEWMQRILLEDESGQYPRFIDARNVNCELMFKKNHRSLPLLQVNNTYFLCQYKSHCFAVCHCCDFDACDCEMSCPDNCNCYYDQAWINNIVDCSASPTFKHKTVPSIPIDVTQLYLDSNELHSLSSHTFIGRKNLRVLHMNNSGIHVINNRTFNGLKALKLLNLRHNHLTSLRGYEFEPLTELRELYLSYNKIAVIANRTFAPLLNLRIIHLDHNYIYQFTMWNLNTNNRLYEVQLAHNSWSCECSFLKQATAWLKEKRATRVPLITDAHEMQCVYNASTAMTLLAPDFNVSSCTSFSPPPNMAHTHAAFNVPEFVPLVAIISSMSLLVVITIIVIVIYRREVNVWFFSRFGVRIPGRATANREDEKLFDCFISYSKMDEAFVTQILAPELEYGNPPFRLCLHYRDLPVVSGYLSSDAIVEAMEASRRSILVISENFLKNEWCRYGFKSAHLEVLRSNSLHKLILIFVGKINPSDFDPDIRFWLKRSTFLQWDEKMFWEKLRYAMPDVSSRKSYPDQAREMTIAVHI